MAVKTHGYDRSRGSTATSAGNWRRFDGRPAGLPNDVAEAALYLVSDRSDWVSGIVLDVAGGSVLA